MQTFIFSKDINTDTVVQCDVTPDLKFGETLTSIAVQPISPVSTPALLVSMLSASTDPVVMLTLSQGQVNISYGFQLLVTTSARVFSELVAVVVKEDVQVPYETQSPQSYVDLVDTIEAGQSAIGTAIFTFPPDVDPRGGYVNWEFLDAQAVVYASGNAFDYTVSSNGFANMVLAKAIVNVPSSVPPSDINSKYQLRYTLILNSQSLDNQQQFYSYENVTVVGLTTVPLGTQDQVELQGTTAQMSIVIDKLYDTVIVNIFQDNTLIGSTPVTQFTRVGGGYYYSASFDTSTLPASLESYTVVWQYSNSVEPALVYSESANLWVITPTVLGAITDIKAKINKARTTLYGQPDLLFPPATILLWLRRARDNFNGGPGGFTNFTMLNAKSGVREYWLMYAEVLAIESQYMAEGEKAFNFSGAAISLDVDRTGYLDNAASKIQSRLDNEIKPFKQNLIIKGQTSGDGSADLSKLAQGALGSVGITITPASPWGPYRSGLPYPTVNR